MVATVFFLMWMLPAVAENAAERLLAGYESIPQLSCELRRDVKSADGETVRFLSRIYFQRPDRLHAENLSPVKRRTICDGTILRQYTEGLPRGFSRPVSELQGDLLTNLRMLPGSNANELEPLRGLDEIALPPGDKEAAVRVGYVPAAGKSFVVLSFDTEGRWTRMETFESPEMRECSLRAEWSDFQSLGNGVWMARRQNTWLRLAGVDRTEIVHVENISVEAPIPAAMFDANAFFKGVEFTDSFEKMF